MGDQFTIVVSKEFTDTPGARHYTDGPFSGEEFFDKILREQFIHARAAKKKLTVDLDNVWGYPSSFISGSFGRLRDLFSLEEVLENIIFISNDNPNRPAEIEKNLRERK